MQHLKIRLWGLIFPSNLNGFGITTRHIWACFWENFQRLLIESRRHSLNMSSTMSWTGVLDWTIGRKGVSQLTTSILISLYPNLPRFEQIPNTKMWATSTVMASLLGTMVSPQLWAISCFHAYFSCHKFFLLRYLVIATESKPCIDQFFLTLHVCETNSKLSAIRKLRETVHIIL